MSFGFSVGDFIVIADKAYLVYKRCEEAPGKYASLTKRVLQLRDVLDDIKAYLVQADTDGQIPQSTLRLVSLQAMCRGCNTTLDEVDEFLERYSDVGAEGATRRMISRLKFISSDSEALEKKLEVDASSLQLRLTSLTSLSILNVQDALDRLAEEYRSGARQPTVISRPLVDNRPVDKEEMFEQISEDLEEKDVHPDAIFLNKPFLDEWLSKVIENGGLDEGSTNPLPELRKTFTRDTVTLVPNNEESAEVISVAQSSSQRLAFRPVPLASPTKTQHSPRGNPARDDDNDDLYADPDDDPDDDTMMPDDSFTVLDGNLASGASRQPRSRSDSTVSSAGKPENWHPYDRPVPAYVQEKLQPLFHADPLPDPTSGTTEHRIMRAFHQADYSDEGYLTRRTVLQHLSAALVNSPMRVNADTLEGIVLSFDANRDGQFDDDEFLGLIQELMRRTSQARASQIEAEFTKVVQEAKTMASHRRVIDSKFFLHWGFSRQSGPGQQYFDDILRVPVSLPPKILEDSAFSVMAWEANICVDKISDFEEQWIGIVPKALQNEYLDPLREIRGVARAFTLLENQRSRLALSELDAFLTCTQLTSLLPDYKETQSVEDLHSQLEAAKLKCNFILDALLGFTHSLERNRNFDASVHNFGKFQAWWKDSCIKWRSIAVLNEATDWNFVKDTITLYRTQRLLADVEGLARLVVEDFAAQEDRRVQRRQSELFSTPWAGYIDWATISGWSKKWVSKTLDRREIFLKISVTNPTQVFQTIPKKRAASNDWMFGKVKEYRIYLLPTSTITITVMYVDAKTPEGIMKFKFPPIKLGELDFAKRSTGKVIIERLGGPPCDLGLGVYMDNDVAFNEELSSLKVRDWHTVLLDGSFKAEGPSLESNAVAMRGPAPDYTP